MIIHLWSGPRSLSTCTMYSFGQRSDVMVLDEPLYASWLARNPNVFRPYRDELLRKQNIDGNKVMEDIYKLEGKPIILAKQIAKQFRGLNKVGLSLPLPLPLPLPPSSSSFRLRLRPSNF
jgi:hypothetical protein